VRIFGITLTSIETHQKAVFSDRFFRGVVDSKGPLGFVPRFFIFWPNQPGNFNYLLILKEIADFSAFFEADLVELAWRPDARAN
jgi:hypothetical protein